MAAAKSESEVSEDFLRDYVARGGKVVDTESGEEITPENVDEELKKAGGGEEAQPDSRKEKHARAEKAAPDPEAEARKQAKKEEKAREEAEQKRRAKSKALRDVTTSAANSVVSTAQPIADRISNLSTYGGIALLLVILGFLLFVLVQVNSEGDTRLKLLWYMLNGQTTLQGRVKPTIGETTVSKGTLGGGPPITSSGSGETANPVPGTKKGGPTGNTSTSTGSSSSSPAPLIPLSSYRSYTAF